MLTLEQAAATMQELVKATQGMSVGEMPSPNQIFDIYGRLVGLYAKIGEEMCRKFNAKERAYLHRKIEAAKVYQKGRYDKLTSGDAQQSSLLAVGEEIDKEIETATAYEQYRTLRKSIEAAIDFARSIQSFISRSEHA